MFTGIIESLGSIVAIETANQAGESNALVLHVALGKLPLDNLHIGDSIAVNGACLTVTSLAKSTARFDVSAETRSQCLIGDWRVGDVVNLESALTLQTPLSGHLVSGHIDGSGNLLSRRDNTQCSWLQFETPRSIGRFIAVKGSIAIDGISLTSNRVVDSADTTRFEVALVPHTLTMTTLGRLTVGSAVHLEIDLVARYLHRIAQSDAALARRQCGSR